MLVYKGSLDVAVKPENQFRTGVHKYLPHKLYHVKMSNPYTSGLPDDWYSGSKTDLWLEYKFLPRTPQRGNVKINLSTLQRNWLNDRYAEGRNVGVIVGCPAGGVLLIHKQWDEELTALQFNERLCSRKDLAFQIERFTMAPF